jgi:hypothetical protein
MKKRILVLLMTVMMAMAMTACGGEEEAVAEETVAEESAEEVAGDYTEQQLAFLDEYNTMIDDYNAAVDVFNATPELTEMDELVEVMNQLTEAIEEVGEICNDPSLLTEENMELLRTTSFAETYKLIDQINAYAEGDAEAAATLASIFTIALCGADEAENTFYLLTNDDVTFAAFVLMSEDAEKSMNVVGEVTENEDGSITITEEDGRYLVLSVESIDEESMLLTLEDGTQATMLPWDVAEAIEIVVAIDEATEIVE